MNWHMMKEILEDDHGVNFEDGLTNGEVKVIESRFGFQFPPDLRAFLECGLPVGDRFPDWRSGPEDELRSMLELPVDGILFDVEQNGFWLPEWGNRPKSFAEAESTVRQLIKAAPTLIPIWGHRMMPDRPHLAGNPVFSVHQTDIIHYGCDLRDYLLHEFLCKSELGLWPVPPESFRQIEFWDLERFATRWDDGPVKFDNSKGLLP